MFTFQSQQAHTSRRSDSTIVSTMSAPIASRRVPDWLTMNSPGDQSESQADQAVERVLSGRVLLSSAVSSNPDASVQRKCHCGRTCASCQAEQQETPRLQMKSTGAARAAGSHVPPIVHDVLRSPGRPLDLQTRAFMELRFGFDFGHVRIHNGSEAEQSAEAVHARAYTVGHNIVFGASEYAPSNPAKRRLLAHELAHVVQQRGAANVLQRNPKDEPKKDASKKDTKKEETKKKADPDCKFSVTYTKDREFDCDEAFKKLGQKRPPGTICGRGVHYVIESVSAEGKKCPALAGLTLTEKKTFDGGCMSAAVTPAPDQTCPIKAGGKIDKCYDDYIMCSPLSYINVKNNGGCEETYKQSIIIDGQEVENHTIVFDVDASATDCSTEVKRDGKVISKRR